MKVLSIAYYTALPYLRKKLLIISFIIVPILVIVITTSGTTFSHKLPDSTYREKVGYISSNNSEVSKQFDNYINSVEIKKLIDLKVINSSEDGIKKINNGEIESFVFVENKSQAQSIINFYNINGISEMKSLIEGFINKNNAINAILETKGIPKDISSNVNLKNTSLETFGQVPTIKDAASITCLLLFLFYSAVLGSYSFIYDAKKRTNIRFDVSTVSNNKIILGKSIGVVSVAMIFSIIIIIGTKFLLKVDWDGNYAIIFLALVLFLSIVNSFGIILVSFTKNIFLCGLATFAVNFLLVYPVMGKAYGPGQGSSFDFLLTISPHNYAYEAIIGSIYKGTNADVGLSIIVLFVVALILFGVSLLVGRRKIA